jgi:putative oxidoreductase
MERTLAGVGLQAGTEATWFQRLVATRPELPAAIARVVLGLVMLPHGLQKTLGLLGGYGFSATLGFLTGQAGLPAPVALLVILAESAGALGLIVGLLGRVAAVGIASVMIGAVATVHARNGFFMNWTGAQAGEGFEYHLLALALAAIVIVAGSGAASLDRVFSERSSK